MKGALKRLLKGLSGNKSIPYEEAKKLARHSDRKVRRKLAASEDAKAEILYFLAEDPSPEVRREIAANAATPRQADLLLAGDSDHRVRCGIAAKIAKLAPGLTADEQDKVSRMTYEALDILARDQITRVRQVLSEALKDVADAPPEVIKRLARDAELVVAGPVLEFSPVLTDDDLLEIIASEPIQGALSAISRRIEVTEPVADAVAATDDVVAIAQLLANPNAQIREQTLDGIINRAPDQESWHHPLVNRPFLPPAAAVRLARFVAGNLLETLTEREDLDPETAETIRIVVNQILEEESGGGNRPKGRPKKRRAESARSPDQSPLDLAKEMHRNKKLNEETITGALQSGDGEFVIAALAVLAKERVKVVDKIVGMQSAKGVVAIVWKAGLSMRLATALQAKLAQIQPKNILNPLTGGEFPLSDEEMKWQLDFFSDF